MLGGLDSLVSSKIKLPSGMPLSHKANEKTRKKITAGQQKPVYFRTLLYQKYDKLTFMSCSLAKKVDQRGLSFSHFLILGPNIQVS